MKQAIYPGSFDPPTFGHLDIIKRASALFDKLTVLVLNNQQKNSLFLAQNRVSMIADIVAREGIKNVEVEVDDGLLVDYCRRKDIHTVIRGLRAITDFEYELQIAQVNHVQHPEYETVFLITSLEYSYLSSTIVKEYASYGGDISKFVPKSIIPLIMEKYERNKNK